MNDNSQFSEPADAPTTSGGSGAGLPLRGLAMVLIAVAVLLGLWGLYSLTQTGDETAASGDATTNTAVTSAQSSAQASASSATQPSETAASVAANPTSTPATASDTPSASEDVLATEIRINVLNNSYESGIAESVYNALQSQGKTMGEHGNLPDSAAVVPELTVFYAEGDAAGEAVARELADQIAATNGLPVVATPNVEGLPAEMTSPNQVTLVLTGGINI